MSANMGAEGLWLPLKLSLCTVKKIYQKHSVLKEKLK